MRHLPLVLFLAGAAGFACQNAAAPETPAIVAGPGEHMAELLLGRVP